MSITAIVKDYERFLQPLRALALAGTSLSVQKPSLNSSMEYNLPAWVRLALRYLAISQHSLSVTLLK
jgi:hypothetical protein